MMSWHECERSEHLVLRLVISFSFHHEGHEAHEGGSKYKALYSLLQDLYVEIHPPYSILHQTSFLLRALRELRGNYSLRPTTKEIKVIQAAG